MNIKAFIDRLIPDSIALKRKYKNAMGKKLNLKHPKSFNEKIQWLKLFDRKEQYVQLVDKYEVKNIVSKWIGEEYIIPTLGIYNHFCDINFSNLPEKFVLKCTHDSGSVKVCLNKNTTDFSEWEKWFEWHLKTNFSYKFREWVYKDIKPRIIAEEYIDSLDKKGVVDYKFFCFNGTPELLYISIGLDNHTTAKISFYDMQGNEMLFHRSDYNQYNDAVFPNNFSKMKEIAKTIAKKIDNPFVRIDLYSLENKVYFSEITFYPNAGFIPFFPPEWDNTLGDLIKLPCDKIIKTE